MAKHSWSIVMDDKYETKRYYECHVTITGSVEAVQYVVEAGKWHFSAIDSDLDCGPGVKCYATRQYNERAGLPAAIGAVSEFAEYLKKSGLTVIREKVELIVYDRRYR